LHRSKVIDIDTLEDLEIAEERLASCKLPLGESSWSF
jgi:CMP-N-acetylneuraminic acid synthetase